MHSGTRKPARIDRPLRPDFAKLQSRHYIAGMSQKMRASLILHFCLMAALAPAAARAETLVGGLSSYVPNLELPVPTDFTPPAANFGTYVPNLSISVPDLHLPMPDLSQPHPPGSGSYQYRIVTPYPYRPEYYNGQDYYSTQAQRTGVNANAGGQMGYGDYCVHYQPSLGNCRFNYVAPVQPQHQNNFQPANTSVYKRANTFIGN